MWTEVEICKFRLKELEDKFDESNVEMVQERIALNQRLAVLLGSSSIDCKKNHKNVYECKIRK